MKKNIHNSVYQRKYATRIAFATIAWICIIVFLWTATADAFATMVVICAGITLYEYCRMFNVSRRAWAIFYGLFGAFGCAMFHQFDLHVSLGANGIAATLMFIACLFNVNADAKHEAWVTALISSFGYFYISMPLGLMVRLRSEPSGANLVALIAFCTWSRDIGAGLIGRVTTGSPMIPSISQTKTLIGAIGGIFSVSICLSTFALCRSPTLGSAEIVTLSLLFGFFGQIADLFESMLKRFAGVRHSGSIVINEGGMLDTIDGFLFTVPVSYIYFATFFPMATI